ncbi:hypothetical protein ASC97_03610 [Rhizobium sp. Root1203]|uniref:hypothetical protein n=1 Tax=Rhizobium sp. Root1203 TaxID=1736427 RepID=UPI00070F6FC1|nr:hypothetical protein ASC97_03610 [Rhizobium sp. Root1203]
MPEMNESKKLSRWSLTNAAEAGQVIVVTCHHCRITHRYLPQDLLQFRDDVSLDRLSRHFRCERCGNGRYIVLKVHDPFGADFGNLPIRRLEKVQIKKVPVWKDGVL